MLRKFVISLALVVASLIAARIALAQKGTVTPTAEDVNRVARQLYCPVCPNTPLDVCETKACQDWRAQIKDQLAAGWTDDQVIQYFVAQYGERVLAEPRRSGFTSFVWLLPIVVTVIGLAAVALILRSWKARRVALVPAALSPPPVLPPDIAAQVEKELREIS